MKEERKNNIKIKGDIGEIEMTKEGIEKYIKEKIGIEIKIINCRTSGNVIIATIEEEEMKKEVIKHKNRLKGGRVFIENDFTWEERKIQEKINNWVKGEKEKGKDVKVHL